MSAAGEVFSQHVHAATRLEYAPGYAHTSSLPGRWLRRGNRVRTYVSKKRGERFGFADCNYDGVQVSLDPSELSSWVGDHDRFYSELEEATAGSPTRWILCERLAERSYLREILDFLNVRPSRVALRTDSLRQSRDSLRTAIANFDELSRACPEQASPRIFRIDAAVSLPRDRQESWLIPPDGVAVV